MYSENFIDEFISTCESFMDYEAEYEFDGNMEIQAVATEGIGDALKSAGGVIVGAFKAIGEWIAKKWNQFITFIKRLINKIKEKRRVKKLDASQKSSEKETLVDMYAKDLTTAADAAASISVASVAMVTRAKNGVELSKDESKTNLDKQEEKLNKAIDNCSEIRSDLGNYKGAAYNNTLVTGLQTAISKMEKAKNDLVKATSEGSKFVKDTEKSETRKAVALSLKYTKKAASAIGKCMAKATSFAQLGAGGGEPEPEAA